MVKSWLDVRLHLVHAGLKLVLRTEARPEDRLVRLGSELCGWWLPEASVRPGAVAYCAGAGEDITFDIEILDRGCKVRTFDPTPLAVAHIAELAIEDEGFTFVPVGWWDSTTELDFFAAKEGLDPVNRSAVNLQRTEESLKAPVKSVRQHMLDLGDDQIDICKIDIEGAEYVVLDSMIEDEILPSVLLIEFDQPNPPKRTIEYVKKLKSLGYRLARIDFFNYTFIRDSNAEA